MPYVALCFRSLTHSLLYSAAGRFHLFPKDSSTQLVEGAIELRLHWWAEICPPDLRDFKPVAKAPAQSLAKRLSGFFFGAPEEIIFADDTQVP